MKEKASGWEMNSVSGCGRAAEVGVDQPGRLADQREEEGGGDPDREADRERRQRAQGDAARRSTTATQRPASGPNSGPTTIAPTIRIGESRKMPTEAIRQASTMKTRKLPPSSMLSEVRASTSSQTTASEGDPRAARSAAFGRVGDLRVDLLERDRAVAVDAELLQVADHHAGVLAGDVAEDHVALGLAGRRRRGRPGCRPRASLRAGRATLLRAVAGTTIRRWTMRGSVSAATRRLGSRAVLTDYHLHLRPDEPDTPPERYFTAENVERYLAAAAEAGIEELGVSEHVYRFTPGARPLAPSVLGGAGARRPRRLLRVRRARRRCGWGSSATSSPAPRTAPPRCSRRATSTTWSARSTSSATRAVDHEGWDVWEGKRRPRRGLAPLLRGARRVRPLRPLRHPRPPRPGQGLGRRPAAARARPALLLRAGGRGDRRERHRGRGLDRRPAQAGRRDLPGAAPSPRCASRRAPPSRSPPTPTCPSRSASATTGAVEFLDDLGRGGDLRLRGRASAGWSRSGRDARGFER